MDLEKEYYFDGIKCNILEMMKREPEWAANRLQEGEKHFEELCRLRNASQPTVEADVQKLCRYCGGAHEMNFNYCGMCGRDLRTA